MKNIGLHTSCIILAGLSPVGLCEEDRRTGEAKITGPFQHINYIQGAACDISLFADTDGKTYAVIPRGKLFFGGHAAIYDTQRGTRWFSYRNEVLGSPQPAKLCVDSFVIDKDGKVQTPAPAQQLNP